MQKFLISPLLCLVFTLALPAKLYAHKSEEVPHEPTPLSATQVNLDLFASVQNLYARVIRGECVTREEVIEALAVVAEHSDEVGNDQAEHMDDMFDALIDAIEEGEDAVRDCSSLCDDTSLKIRNLLCVLNKAIFCDTVVFRNMAIFTKRVEMKDGLTIEGRLRAHKAKIDKLEARKAEIRRLEADRAEIEELEVTDTVTTCDLVVDCNIFMNDSTSPDVGNIYKDGDRFIHNFGTNNTFVGDNAGNFTMVGAGNSGFGVNALQNNTTGSLNIAVGNFALQNNTTGENNTAVGFQVMQTNTTGSRNTAFGLQALFTNTIGNQNTAIGGAAMLANTTGSSNTALGRRTLLANTTGNNNTAVGHEALLNNTTGSDNIAVGINAGDALTAGNNNIDIGNVGVAGESDTIRIGTTQTRNFQVGIRGVLTGVADAVPVLIDSNGQLGTMSSSLRFKENIENICEESSSVFDLRPVSFSYKMDPTHLKHYGLIAEEVQEILPLLVIRDGRGRVETVKYQEVFVLLLNELIKMKARLDILEEQCCY